MISTETAAGGEARQGTERWRRKTEKMMKVFICWSGDTSMQIAALLRDWLPKVNQRIEPFMSHVDIGKGVRWTAELDKVLEDSNFGLVCLTPENLSAP